MSRLVFDVVVVGGELCGLAAAALLAHGGKRVLVVDDGDHATRPLGDRLCPLAPSVWRMPVTGPVAGFFDLLGLKSDARRLLGDTVGVGVADDDDLRCVVPVGEDSREREFARCFGDERGAQLGRAVTAFDAARRAPLVAELAALHEDGWWFEARRARRRVTALGPAGRLDDDDGDVANLWGDGTGLAPVVAQLAPFVQARAGARDRGLAGFLAATQLCAGVPASVPLGARATLHELLRGFLLHHGGDVISDRIESVVATGKRITALHTTTQRLEILPRAVIDATCARDLATRLPTSRRREKLLSQQARVADATPCVGVRWLLPAAALPRGMPPVLLVLGDQAPPVLVSVVVGAPSAEAGKGAHLDEKLVCVVAASPTDDDAHVTRTLLRLLPFTERRVTAKDVVDARSLLGALEVKTSEHVLGGRRPRTAFANLVRAGRDLAPGFGIDGELVSARSVTTLVERALPPPPT